MRLISSSFLLFTCIIILCASALLSLVFTANAAPILSLGQMYREATHVWTGVITEVDKKEHDQEGFIDWKNEHYRLTVKVTKVGKTQGKLQKVAHHHKHAETEAQLRHNAENLPPHTGENAVAHPDHVDDELHDDETINVGDEIHVHFWKAISRPPGYKLPDSPGIRGMSNDIELVAGTDQELAFFGEYLQRDQVRRYMYHHTHPGKIRRRKHTNTGSRTPSKSEVENTAAGGEEEGNNKNQQEEEFSFVKSYMAFVPDGITLDVDGALAAKDAKPEDAATSQSKKVDL